MPELIEQIKDISGEEVYQFVCFKMGSEEYALDITDVQEVIRYKQITPVPQMPDFTLGVVNIRGSVIPVFDIRKKFRLPEKPVDSFSRIVVVRVNDVNISFIVEEMLDNIKFRKSQIDPVPPVKMAIDKSCIKGIGEFTDRMVIILDLKNIHIEIKKSIFEMN
ncbi:chemotaxis protein CheW [bacterium]|nr:chemotaxis protein CheW [bacterium]